MSHPDADIGADVQRITYANTWQAHLRLSDMVPMKCPCHPPWSSIPIWTCQRSSCCLFGTHGAFMLRTPQPVPVCFPKGDLIIQSNYSKWLPVALDMQAICRREEQLGKVKNGHCQA